MTILARYLTRRVITFGFLVLGGLVVLALTFELMEESGKILRSSANDPFALARFSVLRLPDLISRMMPIAALLGTLIAFSLLLRHGELVAVWNGGVSTARLMRFLLPATLAVVVVQLVLTDRFVPPTLSALAAWGVGDIQRQRPLSSGETLWLKSGADIIRVPEVAARAGRLDDLQIFRRDSDGVLVEHMTVRTAERQGEGWLLRDVVRRTIDPPAIVSLAELSWQGRIDIDHVSQLSSSIRELGLEDIWRLIANDAFGQRPTYLYHTWLQYRLAAALQPMMMILLVVALSQRLSRAGGFARLLLVSLALGFAFSVLDATSLAFGEAGLLPPFVAAWSANLVLASLIAYLLIRLET
jgi:lipopolysaccharide export system permease protein